MKKGIVILITFIIILIIPINNTYCENTEETLESQQSEFKINDFIESAQKYGGEFFENIKISDLLNDAIKGEVNNSNIAKKVWDLFRKRSKKQYQIIRKHFSNNTY